MKIALPERSNEYSSAVKLTLVVGADSMELSETGPDSIIVRCPRRISPCEAELVIQIDDHVQRQPVYLPVGIDERSPVVQYRRIDGKQGRGKERAESAPDNVE